MSRNDKIELIQKNLGASDTWIIESCLKLLKAYDKEKKDHRIKLLTKLKN